MKSPVINGAPSETKSGVIWPPEPAVVVEESTIITGLFAVFRVSFSSQSYCASFAEITRSRELWLEATAT